MNNKELLKWLNSWPKYRKTEIGKMFELFLTPLETEKVKKLKKARHNWENPTKKRYQEYENAKF